jgi:hypothetical protein
MSLNQIKLTAKLTADLYSNSLINYSTNRAPHYEIKFLGNNHSKVLIIVNNKDVAFVNDLEMLFLTNVLNACNLKIDDVCLMNIYSFPIEKYREILKELNSKITVMFDVEPVHFGLPVNSAFQIKKSDDLIYMYAPSLLEIEKEKELKHKLWSSLKQIFSI